MHCECGEDVFVEAYQGDQRGAACLACGTFYPDSKMERLAESEIEREAEMQRVKEFVYAKRRP